MAKPDHTWTGSSSHVHVSLWDAPVKKTSSPSQRRLGEMSQTMRHFLGGLLAGSRELSLFIASNINSYKRYAVASWAPVNIVWSRDNRTCGFRIVGSGRHCASRIVFPAATPIPTSPTPRCSPPV